MPRIYEIEACADQLAIAMMIKPVLHPVEKQPSLHEPIDVVRCNAHGRVRESKIAERHENELGGVVGVQNAVAREGADAQYDGVCSELDTFAKDPIALWEDEHGVGDCVAPGLLVSGQILLQCE